MPKGDATSSKNVSGSDDELKPEQPIVAAFRANELHSAPPLMEFGDLSESRPSGGLQELDLGQQLPGLGDNSVRILRSLISPIHRRLTDHDLWHYCTACVGWPTEKFVEHSDTPSGSEICMMCRALVSWILRHTPPSGTVSKQQYTECD